MAKIVGAPESLWEFMSLEENILLVSVRKFPQELDFYNSVNQLYLEPLKAFGDPKTGLKQSFLHYSKFFHFSHTHFYLGMALLLRGHLSSGYHSLRTAIDAALNAYLIMEGSATAEEYINGDQKFVQSIRTINNERKKDESKYKLAPNLIELHKQCGQFASHADPMTFIHRFSVQDIGPALLTSTAYFQYIDVKAEHQLYLMSYLDAHVLILQIFQSVLRSNNVIDQKWSEKVNEIGKGVRGAKKILRKALNIPDNKS